MSSLVDLINQLVNVCGVSAVQEKHIALLKTEAAGLEKKVAELTIEKAILLNKIRALEMVSQNTLPLKNNDQSIQTAYQHFGQEQSNYFPLNERELKILIKVSMKEKISPNEISLSLDMSEQVVGFYLKELEAQEMVIHIPASKDGDLWSLSPKGHKYLVDNKLII